MTSVTAKSSIRAKSDTVTTVSDGGAKDMLNKVVEGKSNGRLTRSSSMNEKFAIDGKPNSRRRLRRSLSLKETSSSVGVDSRFDDPFAEVFMDRGETNQTTCPSGSSLGPSTIPFKSPLIQSTKTLSHRSKSSPSLSKSSPVTSKSSSSLPKGSLNSPKSLVSTSPTLFKSPPIDPKLSPASSHSTKTLDISIPLTPVKSAHLKLVESYTKRTDPSCTDCSTAVKQHRDSTSSANTRKSPGKCSPSPRTKLRNIVPRARFDDLKSPNQRNGNEDLENVVGTTPRLIRKRSLMYSAEPIACKKDVKSKNFVCSEVSQKSSFTESRTPAVSVKEKNGGCSVTSDSVAQQSEREVTEQKADSNSSGFQEQSEVFTSPVGKKRKRSSPGSEHTSGSVSPLNQILKQRKNLRKTPPGKIFLRVVHRARCEMNWAGCSLVCLLGWGEVK